MIDQHLNFTNLKIEIEISLSIRIRISLARLLESMIFFR